MKFFSFLASILALLNIKLEAIHLRSKSKSLQEIPKNINIKEDETSLTYIIMTPQFPAHVTAEDIVYFMYPDKLVLWAKGSEDIVHKEYVNEDENKMEDMRGVNTGRDWELWLNFVKPLLANATNKPMISFGKRRLPGNSYEVKVTLPKAALQDHYIKVHRIYDYNDTARMTKIDYRMKLPQNPHYVKRVVNYPDGHSAEIFTVTNEDSRYYKELNESIFSNDTFNIMNDTQSLMSLITGDDMKRSLIKIDDLKTDKTRNFHLDKEPQQTSD